jgi:hypothetical protein
VFCHERAPEVSPSFADVKDRLMQDLLEQKIAPFYDDAINTLMAREMPRFQIQADLFRPDEQAAKPAKPAGGNAPAPAPAAPPKSSKPKPQ